MTFNSASMADIIGFYRLKFPLGMLPRRWTIIDVIELRHTAKEPPWTIRWPTLNQTDHPSGEAQKEYRYHPFMSQRKIIVEEKSNTVDVEVILEPNTDH